MGLDNGAILAEQLSASSSSTDLLPNIRLTSPSVWHPKIDNPHQYLKIDFLEPRNITGIATKGGEDTWTTVYKVFYSDDDRDWSPVIDEYGVEKEFLGNFDSETVKKNYFERPLRARHLLVQPVKWHEHIGLKLEVLGCFLPYRKCILIFCTNGGIFAVIFIVITYAAAIATTTEKVETTPTAPQIFTDECNVCEGVSKGNQVACNCKEPYWWNGNTCVIKQECPCVVGHIK